MWWLGQNSWNMPCYQSLTHHQWHQCLWCLKSTMNKNQTMTNLLEPVYSRKKSDAKQKIVMVIWQKLPEIWFFCQEPHTSNDTDIWQQKQKYKWLHCQLVNAMHLKKIWCTTRINCNLAKTTELWLIPMSMVSNNKNKKKENHHQIIVNSDTIKNMRLHKNSLRHGSAAQSPTKQNMAPMCMVLMSMTAFQNKFQYKIKSSFGWTSLKYGPTAKSLIHHMTLMIFVSDKKKKNEENHYQVASDSIFPSKFW